MKQVSATITIGILLSLAVLFIFKVRPTAGAVGIVVILCVGITGVVFKVIAWLRARKRGGQ